MTPYSLYPLLRTYGPVCHDKNICKYIIVRVSSCIQVSHIVWTLHDVFSKDGNPVPYDALNFNKKRQILNQS